VAALSVMLYCACARKRIPADIRRRGVVLEIAAFLIGQSVKK
jgi:hypothetical protein